MDIKLIETTLAEGEPLYERGGRKFIAVIEDHTEVTMYGVGQSDYVLRVRSVQTEVTDTPPDERYNPAVRVLEAAAGRNHEGAEFWGLALVWASNRTVCHVVMDFLASY